MGGRLGAFRPWLLTCSGDSSRVTALAGAVSRRPRCPLLDHAAQFVGFLEGKWMVGEGVCRVPTLTQ